MSSYLKALSLHAYFATTKKSYYDNGKCIEVNAQAIDALRQILGKEHLSIASHCEITFAVLKTLISPKKQAHHILERKPRRVESEQTCYMV